MLRITVGAFPRCAITDREGVHDDHNTAGVVTDAVRDVAKQELFPPRHSHIADHEDVDRLPLSGANNRHRRIVIDDEQRTAALPGELPGIGGELLAGGDRSGVFGSSVLGGGRAVRYDYLHDDQVGAAALGQRGGPENRLVRRFGPIGPHHHTPHRSGQGVAFRSSVRGFIDSVSHGDPPPSRKHS